MADVKVSVRDGAITVDKDKVQVWVGKDKVKWQGNDEFGIVLPAPYTSPRITQQGGKWVGESGPFETEGTTIKYDVTAPNADTLDPEIQVLP